jgi:hypothetical protein
MKFAQLTLHVQVSFSSSYILNTLAGYVPVIEYIWSFYSRRCISRIHDIVKVDDYRQEPGRKIVFGLLFFDI